MQTTYLLTLQWFGHNFECKVAACSHHPCAPNYCIISYSFDLSIQYSTVTIANMWLQSL